MNQEQQVKLAFSMLRPLGARLLKPFEAMSGAVERLLSPKAPPVESYVARLMSYGMHPDRINPNVLKVNMLHNARRVPPTQMFRDIGSAIREGGFDTINAGHVTNPAVIGMINNPRIRQHLENAGIQQIYGTRDFPLRPDFRKPIFQTTNPLMPWQQGFQAQIGQQFEKISFYKQASRTLFP